MTNIFPIHSQAARYTLVLSVALSLLSLAGCGGYRGQKETSVADAVVGEPMQIEGVLSLRGSTPHTALVLEISKDEVVMIHSKTIQAELKSLSGMRVAIEGESLPSIDGETPLINALRYRLLRLPSGELPVVGVVSVVGSECLLEAADGKRYWIRGDFTSLIGDFDGAKIWVIGALGDPEVPDKPKGTVPYWVTGYGVLSTP